MNTHFRSPVVTVPTALSVQADFSLNRVPPVTLPGLNAQ